MLFQSNIVVTCLPHLSETLTKEIKELCLPVVASDSMSVTVKGGLAEAMLLNLHLRTANKVLLLIDEFSAYDANRLYRKIKQIPWEEYFGLDKHFSVASYTKNDTIRDTRFANLKAKDAVADRFMEKLGQRPDSGKETDEVCLFFHWQDTKVKLYYDTSGDTLSKHGYRAMPFAAPMLEALASAAILNTCWDRKSPFVNPMCGSGTLAIEAALLAMNKAPGLLRKNFSFMHLKCFDADLWNQFRRKAASEVVRQPENVRIIATDHSPEAMAAARQNAKSAGVDHLIEFKRCDFEDTFVPRMTGVVVLNPEYGARLGEEKELEETYRNIGDFFKLDCEGYTGYIFTGNMRLAKKVGLRTSKRLTFYNARIECRLLEYELYSGSRK
ncbi:MAG: THUMP domain-containing protein [Cytophagales bacterium]|nr:THUMP domain-containing protein [Cytophagales bacterium]